MSASLRKQDVDSAALWGRPTRFRRHQSPYRLERALSKYIQAGIDDLRVIPRAATAFPCDIFRLSRNDEAMAHVCSHAYPTCCD
jgi:hypothetical protein